MWNIKRDGADEAVRRRAQDGIISALERSQAIIEFDPSGRILHANRNFLDAMGYGLDEVHGQHHSMFVDPDQRQSAGYRAFWDKLGRGEFDAGKYKRIAKGGRIVIASQAGQGSRFSLTLPLPLAVLDGMVVSIGSETFVLPLTHIVESLQPRPGDIQPFGKDRSLLNVRGVYVPLVRTAALLGLNDAVPDAGPDAALGVAILVESQGSGRMALLVDAILGQRQAVIKSVKDNYRPVAGIAAATILGDGRVALILDVDGIVARCRAPFANETQLQPTGS